MGAPERVGADILSASQEFYSIKKEELAWCVHKPFPFSYETDVVLPSTSHSFVPF